MNPNEQQIRYILSNGCPAFNASEVKLLLDTIDALRERLQYWEQPEPPYEPPSGAI